MNVNTTELVPSLELSNNLNVMPAMPVMPMLPSYPIPMPMAMPSPYPLNGNFMPLHDKFMQIQNHHEFYVPPNPNSDQYMMEVENMEHLERVTKYRLEVMEGREDAVPPPLPRWNPNKPFTFVNSTLIERLEDLDHPFGTIVPVASSNSAMVAVVISVYAPTKLSCNWSCCLVLVGASLSTCTTSALTPMSGWTQS